MIRERLKKGQFIFHYAAYYLAWVAGIALAALNDDALAVGVVLAITAIQVAWQRVIDRRTQGLWYEVVLLTGIGSLVDSLFVVTGVADFKANPFAPWLSPPWMMALWVNFAVVYYSAMTFVWGRYAFLAFASAFAFPLVYLAGGRLGAVTFPFGEESTLLYGVVWVWLMPLCDYLCQGQGRCHDC